MQKKILEIIKEKNYKVKIFTMQKKILEII